MEDCPSEVTKELHDYYKKRNKVLGDFAKFAQCYPETEDLFVQGDPFAWTSQASMMI